MGRIALGAAIVLALGLLALARIVRIEPGDNPPRVSIQQFEQLGPGMSREQVLKIMRSPGEVQSQSRMESGEWTTEVYHGSAGGQIIVEYRDGLVDHVSQFGLR